MVPSGDGPPEPGWVPASAGTWVVSPTPGCSLGRRPWAVWFGSLVSIGRSIVVLGSAGPPVRILGSVGGNVGSACSGRGEWAVRFGSSVFIGRSRVCEGRQSPMITHQWEWVHRLPSDAFPPHRDGVAFGPRLFSETIPFRGAQLLFEVPDELIPGRSDRGCDDRGQFRSTRCSLRRSIRPTRARVRLTNVGHPYGSVARA